MRLLPSGPWPRRAAIAGYGLVGVAALALLVIAAFPIGLLKPRIERAMTARFGRPVTIGTLDRQDLFSLHPQILIRDLRVPQPVWAGSGDLARISEAEITLATTALLRGRIVPQAIALRGARITLVRDRQGRENWHDDTQGDSRSNHTPVIERLTITDSRLAYRDAKRDRQFVVDLRADTATGLIANGRGKVRGSPVTVSFNGGAIGQASTARWPFRARIDGPDLAIDARGTMASPLDTDRMSIDATTRASDLKYLDAIIEAGLFGTQPLNLSAHVERTAPDWHITRLTGTIGRSRLSAQGKVLKRNARTRIEATVHASLLDLDDLASDRGNAEGIAEQQRLGPLLVPNARIDIGKIDRTDGQIGFVVDRIVSRRGDSAIRDARGTLSLERQLLTIAPLRIGLPQGAITGRVIVDQRGDRPVPTVTMDLRLSGSSVAAIAGGGGLVTGRLDARASLIGKGHSIREAVAASTGRIGLVARDGSLPERIAVALGFDAGRALFAGEDDRAGLRCVIVGIAVKNGRGQFDPLIVDTTQSQLRGEGSLSFPAETLDVTLTGAPKRDAVLRLPGAATMTGTIRRPDIIVPREVKSVGNVLKAIGRAITGRQGPTATDADCAGLSQSVLR